MRDPDDHDKSEIKINVDIFKFNIFCLGILLLTYPFEDVISTYRSALKVCMLYTNLVMLYVIYKSI